MWRGIYGCTLAVLVFSVCLSIADAEGYRTSPNPYDLSNLLWRTQSITGDLTWNEVRASKAPSAAITTLKLIIDISNPSVARITIKDPNNARFEPTDMLVDSTSKSGSMLYDLSFTLSPFGMKVTRLSDSLVIFEIDSSTDFIFNNQEIKFQTNFPTQRYVYGLGERVTDFSIKPGTYTLWNKDQTQPFDDGTGDKQTYGSHPFFLATDDSGSSFGGYFHNINAQEVTVSKSNLVFHTTGGIIDFFVLPGPKPADVISQYHSLIGTPEPPPYWGLGWHQCRYGYTSLDKWRQVVRYYRTENLPLDVMWSDIDYMKLYRNWELDTDRYPLEKTQTFLKELHSLNIHFVPIIDAGIGYADDGSYPAYDEGLKLGVYIMSAYSENKPALGKVWPGTAVFVDWYNPKASEYWQSQFVTFHNNFEFDGIWLDMNEASNFCDGECDHPETTYNKDTMPFIPGGKDLNNKAMDLASKHYGGKIEYDVHNTYGFYESKATSDFFKSKLNKRTFIITRSTLPGSGRYSYHWLGDNHSTWEYLKYSIGGIFNANMFGLTIAGSDICGFLEDTNEELCARWTQLGTLYPFSRNHNDIKSIDQEPWAFGETLLTTVDWSIRVKYGLMHYYYSNIFDIGINGGVFFKPAFFEFPSDKNLYELHVDDNFMLGSSLIVHPVLAAGANTVQAYFPAGLWYDFFYGNQIDSTKTSTFTLKAPLPGIINVHIRAGHIVPKLDGWYSAKSVADLKSSTINLIVALNGDNADGFLYFDDMDKINTIPNQEYTRVDYLFRKGSDSYSTLQIKVSVEGYTRKTDEFPGISGLTIYGCKGPISDVDVQDGTQIREIDVSTTYDYDSKICQVYLKELVQPDVPLTLKLNYDLTGSNIKLE
jgi:alpha-glucosidase (family GH31 glycosyl hydrolase)